MSLKELKNTLKSCTSSSLLACSATNSSTQLRTEDQPATELEEGGAGGEEEPPPPSRRKPPKSSLRQQLKSLGQLAADLQADRNDYVTDINTGNKGCALSHSESEETFRKKNDREVPVKRNCNYEGEEDEAGERFRDSEAGVFIQPHTDGPFEPLSLGPCPKTGCVLQVPASINCRLLEHQREGVKFLYNLYRQNHGGVLGDDMGLGKTIQTIAFVAAVLQKDVDDDTSAVLTSDQQTQRRKPILIICPTSVLQNWENEFNEWGTFSIAIYHGVNKELVLEKMKSSVIEIILTSFDTFRIHGESLCGIQWEVVIIDEAHRLKNERSQLYKAFQNLRTKKCYGLTGTIMQNKIMDLFNVFDLISSGCLGTREHFREYYDEPLKQGQRISAPERFVEIAEVRKKHLLKVLRRYLLRRTKEETIGHLMMGKEDNVVFCAMSPLQKRVYKRLLESPDYQSLILKDLPCSCGSKLTRVECCHRTVPGGIIWSYLHRDNPDGCESCPFCLVLPCIIKLQQVCNHLELIKPNPKDDTEKQKKDEALAQAVFVKDVDLVGGIDQNESFMGLSDAQHCGKMRALEKLMASWILHGDKILLFSYSVRMLDILEKFLIRKGYCFARLDGSTPMSSRQSLVDGFNQSPSKQVFLISTRAGGIGLNLVSANRVVIFDPNWNPAQDLQAQDRSFRYGQRRHVTVFRLLAAGSLEEIVYTRQIYKQQLFNIAVSGNSEKRYFEGVQDSKEFKGELFGISNLFRDLSDILFTNEIVENHGKRLHSLGNHNQFMQNQRLTKCLQAVSDKNLTKSESHECVEEEKSSPITHGKAVTTSVADEQIENTTMKENQSVKLPDLANMLIDAGVMYVHRNENVVNYRKHNREGTMARECSNLCASNEDVSETRHGSRSQLKDSGPTKVHADSHKCTLREQRKVLGFKKNSRTVAKTMDKNKQYSHLARFKGMGELEFSKWLLSLSSSEMEKLLLDYKRWLLAGQN